MSTIHTLDRQTASRINSGQVITAIDTIVKELLENALDAHATSVDIKLVDDGLELVEVTDNGSGISMENRALVGKKHCTSKIACFEDLEKLETFGFRGEALNALSEMADSVTIATKTVNDPVAKLYTLDQHDGMSGETTTSVIATSGTRICVERAFVNTPVRRQVAMKDRLGALRRIHETLTRYALSHPSVRFACRQLPKSQTTPSKQPPIVKPTATSTIDAVRLSFNNTLASALVDKVVVEEFDQQLLSGDTVPITLHCVLPALTADPACVLATTDRFFFYINQRPINYAKSELREIATMMRKRYKQAVHMDDDEPRKTPFVYLDISMSNHDFDVNVEPDKSTVYLHDKQRLLTLVERVLDDVYGSFFHHGQATSGAMRPPANESADVQPRSLHTSTARAAHRDQWQVGPDRRNDAVLPRPYVPTAAPTSFSFIAATPTTTRPSGSTATVHHTPNTNRDHWQIGRTRAPVSTPAIPLVSSAGNVTSSTTSDAQTTRPAVTHVSQNALGKRPERNPTTSMPLHTEHPLFVTPAVHTQHQTLLHPSHAAKHRRIDDETPTSAPQRTKITKTSMDRDRHDGEKIDDAPSASLRDYFGFRPRTISSAVASSSKQPPAQAKETLSLISSQNTAGSPSRAPLTTLLKLLGTVGDASSTFEPSLNYTSTCDTSILMQQLPTTYPRRRQCFKKRHGLANDAYKHRVQSLIHDKHANSSPQTDMTMEPTSVAPSSPLCVFAFGCHSPIGRVFSQLAVLDTTRCPPPPATLTAAMTDLQVPRTKLVQPLDVLQLGPDDRLYNMIVSLPNEDVHANLDHGTFKVITDRCVIANGFQLQWEQGKIH
ncbi:hypothetical protein BC940DRAFT_311279 [Gongronella butleri]|nr:hypothetical protein BC940DRAFT_311279 [Gongronella butleri]